LKELFIETISGAAGDMLLAAFFDLGVDQNMIKQSLSKLPLDDWEMRVNKVTRAGIQATYVEVYENHTHASHNCQQHENHHHVHEGRHRHLSDMLKLADESPYSEFVKSRARDVFILLAEAEAKVHGKSKEEVHFHEISGIDTAIDVFGVFLALEQLDVKRVICSSVVTGFGSVKCVHGVMPVPAPATTEILANKSIPHNSGTIESELLTPTGIALLAVLCDEFVLTTPQMISSKIGYGAGKRDFTNVPNVLRMRLGKMVGESQSTLNSLVTEYVFVADDMTAEAISHLSSVLFEAGAVEAYVRHVTMKKNRLGHELVVLCDLSHEDIIEQILITQSTTLGFRKSRVERVVLQRRHDTVDVCGLPIRIKYAYRFDTWTAKPEYDDVSLLAKQENLSFAAAAKLIIGKIQSL